MYPEPFALLLGPGLLLSCLRSWSMRNELGFIYDAEVIGMLVGQIALSYWYYVPLVTGIMCLFYLLLRFTNLRAEMYQMHVSN